MIYGLLIASADYVMSIIINLTPRSSGSFIKQLKLNVSQIIIEFPGMFQNIFVSAPF